MSINVANYQRPDIYIEEIDNSVLEQIVTEGIINLVPGFSKKGPFNRNVLLKRTSDLTQIFGPRDRNLEKKESWFHLTCLKMLQSGPVYAINLLAADDTLDMMEYQNISTQAALTNDIKRSQSYRRFFDTAGFWKRSTDSFKNFATYGSLLHFTNFADRKISVFAFKSQIKGFDTTVQNWYAGVPADKIPAFLRPTDLITDYLVKVIVVAGDWSNYAQLAVDAQYSKYFNTSGIRKDQVKNFINDQTVTLLADYDCSLIPYFRNSNGADMFIENMINIDTDRTGLYCAFNYDLIETDFPNNAVDLIGNTLVGTDATTINFLSYKETISEAISYTTKDLNSAGNVIANGAVISSRANDYFDDYVSNFTINATTVATNIATTVYTNIGSGYYNISGVRYNTPVSGIITHTLLPTPGPGLLARRIDVIYLNSTGIQVKDGSMATGVSPTAANPAVNATDIVLAYVLLEKSNTGNLNIAPTFTNVTLNNTGYVYLNAADLAAQVSTNIYDIEFIFNGTSGSIPTSDYATYRRVKEFNRLLAILDGPNKDKAVFITGSGAKTSLVGATIIVDTTADKTIKVSLVDVTADIRTAFIASGRRFTLYNVDNEFITGSGAGLNYAMITKNTVATGTTGVVAKYSSMYQDYVNGKIGTSDYFYEKLAIATSTTADAIKFLDVAGNDYVVMNTTDYSTMTVSGFGSTGDKFLVNGSVYNNITFTIVNVIAPSTVGITNANQTAFQVNENTVAETIVNLGTIDILNANQKIYLEFFLANDVLNVNFSDAAFLTEITLSNTSTFNNGIKIYSDINNYKETLEIEQPTGYVQTPNKVLVNATRYAGVKVGDYLAAYVDVLALHSGEQPKNLTRIINKRIYAADPTLVELTCDSQISLVLFGGTDYQTTRYTNMEDYALTYKAITLGGFRVRAASMPDGTEARQNQILDIIAKGTPLAKSLVNKNKLYWRYLVDSFGLGLQPDSKQQLVDICGERVSVFGFLSMPSMKAFKESSSPSFTDSEGNLVVDYIAQGANPTSNPAFLYSFGKGNGQSTVGYFTPYVTINDSGRPISVPPAMFVATTYMRKFVSKVAGLRPWTVCAGITDGRIESITNIEHDFENEDVISLGSIGGNPIIKDSKGRFRIETEYTAQQTVKSALSYIHVREVLIELETELSEMLRVFQWKFNTSEVRAEIKLRADAICQRFVDRKGLYGYKNVCDDSNNTNTLIDNQLGVLDTYVEPIKALQSILNRINVLKTGGLLSTGFAEA